MKASEKKAKKKEREKKMNMKIFESNYSSSRYNEEENIIYIYWEKILNFFFQKTK